MNVLAYLIPPASSRSPDYARNKTVKMIFGGRKTEMNDEEHLQCFSDIVLDVDDSKFEHLDH